MSNSITKRKLRQLFSEHGYAIRGIVRNRHWKVMAIRNGMTATRIFTVQVSPSDWRAAKNLNAQLKRGH